MPGSSRRAASPLAIAPLAAVLLVLGLCAPGLASAGATLLTSWTALAAQLEARIDPHAPLVPPDEETAERITGH